MRTSRPLRPASRGRSASGAATSLTSWAATSSRSRSQRCGVLVWAHGGGTGRHVACTGVGSSGGIHMGGEARSSQHCRAEEVGRHVAGLRACSPVHTAHRTCTGACAGREQAARWLHQHGRARAAAHGDHERRRQQGHRRDHERRVQPVPEEEHRHGVGFLLFFCCQHVFMSYFDITCTTDGSAARCAHHEACSAACARIPSLATRVQVRLARTERCRPLLLPHAGTWPRARTRWAPR